MKKNEIYDNLKNNRKYEKYSSKRVREILQANLDVDLNDKKNKYSIINNFDRDSFLQGEKWFNEGLSLEDASDDLKNNACFIAGYKKAERTQYVNEQVYNSGIDYFSRGIPFSDVPEIYKNNEFFKAGYYLNSNVSSHK